MLTFNVKSIFSIIIFSVKIHGNLVDVSDNIFQSGPDKKNL